MERLWSATGRVRNRWSGWELGGGVLLRPYRPSDLEAMFLLDQECFAEEFSFDRRSMRMFAEARNAVVAIAEAGDGRLVGFAIAHLERLEGERYGYLVTLDVAKQERRRGLAAALLGQLEKLARGAGSSRMELHVSTENHAAISFYERTGYIEAGWHGGFYGHGLDAFGYTKPLG